jgi:nucleotide-binding universal stress UspA family protein
MSATSALLVIVAVWLALGLAAALAMGRRGHDPFTWLLVGALLGPIGAVLAVLRLRDSGTVRRLDAGLPGDGPVDVLVGLDGSAAARGALSAVLELLGPRLGRLTLAGVGELDDTAAERAHEQALRAELRRQAAAIGAGRTDRQAPAWTPATVLLTGEPAAALERLAVSNGYDLLAVGSRGSGLTTALLGSVATRLAAGAKVPVLVAADRTA